MNKSYAFGYEETPTELLSASDKELVEKAIAIAQDAYVPYSTFHVGAAVRLENGVIVTGSNQENAAYPSGTCAERTALFYANAKYPNVAVQEMAVVAIYHGEIQDQISPCGSCRQVMAEVATRFRPYRVLLVGKDTTKILPDNRLLLPFTFDSSAL